MANLTVSANQNQYGLYPVCNYVTHQYCYMFADKIIALFLNN